MLHVQVRERRSRSFHFGFFRQRQTAERKMTCDSCEVEAKSTLRTREVPLLPLTSGDNMQLLTASMSNRDD